MFFLFVLLFDFLFCFNGPGSITRPPLTLPSPHAGSLRRNPAGIFDDETGSLKNEQVGFKADAECYLVNKMLPALL